MSATDPQPEPGTALGAAAQRSVAEAVVLRVATDSILHWRHRHGELAACLVRVRGDRRSPGAGWRVAVVVSELANNPPRHLILSDFAGLAAAAITELLPAAVTPDEITWYAHHGPFSSYDPTGPETLTRVELAHDGQHFGPPDRDAQHRLTPAQHASCVAQLGLAPAEQVLADAHAAGLWPGSDGISAPRR